jgi:glycosyltransferase involved in cell wall biosynthesis
MTAPIRVLFAHFGEDWIRGSETVLLDLLRALNKDVVSPTIWCNGFAMADAVREAGFPVVRGDMVCYSDYGYPRFDLAGYRRMIAAGRALCREHRIQVLHANGAAPVQWLVPVGLSERLPILAHLHIDYLRRSRYVNLLHAATLAVGVSAQVTEGLIEDRMAADRVRVIYNGIDISRFSVAPAGLRNDLGIPADAMVVATAGSLIARKGHDILLRAFRALPDGDPKPHLLIAGEGPEQAALLSLADSLGLADRVHFLGHVQDIARVYTTADIFALASRGDALCLALVEAGHFGLASVSTKVGGIPEAIADEKTGILVPPDDPSAFSHALGRLIGDPSLRAEMGEAARQRVARLFAVERMARSFEEAYLTLAAIPASELGGSQVLRRLRPYARLLATIGRQPPPRYAAA